MSIVDKFLGIFKRKEEVNEKTVTEKVIEGNEAIPRIVEDTDNSLVMVRADDFADSSITPEEYKVADENNDKDNVTEQVEDPGITIGEGDDMTPIIMEVPAEKTVQEEKVEEVLEVIEESGLTEQIEESEKSIEVNEEVLEPIAEVDEEIEIL